MRNLLPRCEKWPQLCWVSQAISVAKSSQYYVLHNGHIWISQFLSSYPVILTFADTSYLIEWTYRISHAFFWEWFLPLTWSTVLFRSRARAPPTLSHPPPPSPSSCLTTPFGRFFREPRWKHLPPAPWFEVQGVPCFKSNGRSSSAVTEARRPVLLSRDDPQGREARFSHNGETRPKVLPVGELSWLSTEWGKRRLPESCKLQVAVANYFLCWKNFVRLAWREASCASRQSASLRVYSHRQFSHEWTKMWCKILKKHKSVFEHSRR